MEMLEILSMWRECEWVVWVDYENIPIRCIDGMCSLNAQGVKALMNAVNLSSGSITWSEVLLLRPRPPL